MSGGDAEASPFPAKRPKQMKMKRDPKKLRTGGGKVWEDHSLDDWDQGQCEGGCRGPGSSCCHTCH